jgi:hypothetical protein
LYRWWSFDHNLLCNFKGIGINHTLDDLHHVVLLRSRGSTTEKFLDPTWFYSLYFTKTCFFIVISILSMMRHLVQRILIIFVALYPSHRWISQWVSAPPSVSSMLSPIAASHPDNYQQEKYSLLNNDQSFITMIGK